MPLPMALKKTAMKYAEMMEDGRILSNRASIDIIDGRILQLLERIDVDEAPERLKNLYDMFQEMNAARRKGKEAEVISLMMGMEAEFEKAYHDYAAWEQMVEVFDLRRKLIDSEIKVVKEMKAILTAEQAYKLVAKLMAVCIRLIEDPKLLRRINYEFSRIIGENKLQQQADVVEGEFDMGEEEED